MQVPVVQGKVGRWRGSVGMAFSTGVLLHELAASGSVLETNQKRLSAMMVAV
jgi:hypothetical protein